MQPFYVSTLTPPSVSAHGIVNSLSRDVYVSIDLDVFDPSIMPAVGTPEAGGIQWHEVLNVLRSPTLHKHVVGFDLVELCPTEGTASCAFLADKVAYRLIGYAMS